MKIIETGFEGLYELEPEVFGDQRGYFFESYRSSIFQELGLNHNFVQDNESYSLKGTLRGLHFQALPHAQAKLVRVTKGRVLDVVLDIRSNSPTYGKHHSVLLEEDKHNMLMIPEGFAHGFQALEDSVFSYKCSSYYNKAAEGGILWNDPELAIEWNDLSAIVSEKDQEMPKFEAYKRAPKF